MPDTFYTVADVAKLIRMSPDSVERLIRSRKLRASNVGGGEKKARWIIASADLQAFLAARSNGAGPTSPAPKSRRKPRSGDIPNYFGGKR